MVFTGFIGFCLVSHHSFKRSYFLYWYCSQLQWCTTTLRRKNLLICGERHQRQFWRLRQGLVELEVINEWIELDWFVTDGWYGRSENGRVQAVLLWQANSQKLLQSIRLTVPWSVYARRACHFEERADSRFAHANSNHKYRVCYPSPTVVLSLRLSCTSEAVVNFCLNETSKNAYPLSTKQWTSS